MSNLPKQLRKLAPFLSCWEDGETGLPTRDDELLFTAANEIETLRERAEKAESERDRLRESAASLCVSIEKQKSYGLPAISPQTAIALRDIRAALRHDEGDDE